jgi:dTDP-4-dehydrorhamnose reductase
MSCATKKIGALVIHYSTDYVFDGSNKSPYEEADQPNPINVYGKTKLAGEEALRNSGATHLIFRTSWVYSTRRKNFLLTILGLATEKEELSIVADQIGSPTCAADIAAATSRILAQFLKAQQLNRVDDYIGTYHMTAAGQTSWHEFADTILAFAHSGRKYPPWFTEATGGHPLVTTRVAPISTHQFGSPTLRPSYSVLSNSRLTRTFGISLAHWRTQLDDCFSLQRSVL